MWPATQRSGSILEKMFRLRGRVVDPSLNRVTTGGQTVQVAVRPESVRLIPLSAAGTPGVVPGKIAEVTFLGNIIDCYVTLDDGTRIRAQVDSGRVLEVGQAVGVEFDSRQASVFSA